MVYLEENKLNSIMECPQYCKVCFYLKHIPAFKELVIKNTPIKKVRPFFVFMEWLHLPHG